MKLTLLLLLIHTLTTYSAPTPIPKGKNVKNIAKNTAPITNATNPCALLNCNDSLLADCIKCYVPLYLAVHVTNTIMKAKELEKEQEKNLLAMARKYYPQPSLSVVPEQKELKTEDLAVKEDLEVANGETSVKLEEDIKEILEESIVEQKKTETPELLNESDASVVLQQKEIKAGDPAAKEKTGVKLEEDIKDALEESIVEKRKPETSELLLESDASDAETIHSNDSKYYPDPTIEDQHPQSQTEEPLKDSKEDYNPFPEIVAGSIIEDTDQESQTHTIEEIDPDASIDYEDEDYSIDLPPHTIQTNDKPRTYFGYMTDQYTYFSLTRSLTDLTRQTLLATTLSTSIHTALSESTYTDPAHTQLLQLTDTGMDAIRLYADTILGAFHGNLGKLDVVLDKYWKLHTTFNVFFTEFSFNLRKVLDSIRFKKDSVKLRVQVEIIEGVVMAQRLRGEVEVFMHVVNGSGMDKLRVNSNWEFLRIKENVGKQIKSYAKRLESLGKYSNVDGSEMRDFGLALKGGMDAWEVLRGDIGEIEAKNEFMDETLFDLVFRKKYEAFSEKSDVVKEKLKKGLRLLSDNSRNAVYEKRVITGEVQEIRLEWKSSL